MAHPFFESDRFPLQRAEGDELLQRLRSVFTNPAEITLMYEQAGGSPGALTPGQSAWLLWPEVLNQLAAARLLETFCERLRNNARVGTNAQMLAAIDAIASAKPLVDLQIVSERRLVLDRVELRAKLRALSTDNSTLRVVLVRGGDDTGKSWGRHVFESAAKDRGAVAVYLSANQNPTVDMVVSDLFAAVQATDKIPPKLTTPAAWYSAVCAALSDMASRRQQQLWAAIDDIALIDPEICTFCDQFVAKMESPAFSQWFRLMLIHYPADRSPTTWQDEVWDEDTTSDADVQVTDVISFFKSWADDRGYKVLDAHIEQLAQAAIAQADTPPQPNGPALPRLKRLHDHLVSTLAQQGQALAAAPPAEPTQPAG